MDLGLSGLASGLDWRTLISQLIDVERAPEKRMQTEQNTLQQRNNGYGSIKTQLLVLQNRIKALSDPALFSSSLSESSDPTAASVNSSTGAAAGTYVFKFSQLASSARQRGTDDIGQRLSATDDVSGLALSSAGFTTGVTTGTFTINGKMVTVGASDTLQTVFDNIEAATGGAVTAKYSAATDQITLESASEITLGSATDTSNFVQAAKLYNNGSGTITSLTTLGGVRLSQTLASANLAVAVTDGGADAGEFKINGVSISFTTDDRVQDVLDRINRSGAGVMASYDSLNDRFTLTDKATGDVGIALEDVTGNFLAATGLTNGTLERGQNLIYSVNGGGNITSQSNTVTEDSSGLTGLSVTARQETTVTVTVSNDTSKIKGAINDFLTEYNKTQSLIDSQTASSTDAKGTVTAGILTGESDPDQIASQLRSLAYAPVTGLDTSLKSLASLGITSNGNDNTLSLDDESKLDAALSDDLSGIKALFTDSSIGLAVRLNDFAEKTAGEDGTLVAKQSNLTKQASSIDTQISDFERQIQSEQQRLTDSFVAMETAQSQINQQLQFLQQRFGTSSSSTS